MTDAANNESLPPVQSLSFEEAFTRLGAMVETLEAGGLPLEQATTMFEQGMSLARRCSQLLEATEMRIAEIRENGGGNSAAQPAGLSWGDIEMPPPDDEWQPDMELLDND